MKLADGWLLSAFSCRQAFILEVCSVFLLVGFVGCLFSDLLWCLSCMLWFNDFFSIVINEICGKNAAKYQNICCAFTAKCFWELLSLVFHIGFLSYMASLRSL